MSSPVKKYGFINAKLRARISKLLPEEIFNQLVSSQSLTECMHVLGNTSYAHIETAFTSTGDISIAELELFASEISTYLEIKKYLEIKEVLFVDSLLVRFEAEVVKAAVRLWFDRTVRKRNISDRTSYIYRGKLVNSIDVDEIVNAANFDELISITEGTPYRTILENNRYSIEHDNSLFYFENSLDRFFYSQLLEACNNLDERDRKSIEELVRVEIDIMNINWLLRYTILYPKEKNVSENFIIPSGKNISQKQLGAVIQNDNQVDILQDLVIEKYKTLKPLLATQGADNKSRLVLIERLLDEIISEEVHKILRGYPFTLGIVLAYTILKGREIRQVMTIINAKYYEMDAGRIMARI